MEVLLPRDSDPAIPCIFVEHRAEHGDHQRGDENIDNDHRHDLATVRNRPRRRDRLFNEEQTARVKQHNRLRGVTATGLERIRVGY